MINKDTDTSLMPPEDPHSTATSQDLSTNAGANWGFPAVWGFPYNRKVRRYAKKHKITEKEAFKKIYGFDNGY